MNTALRSEASSSRSLARRPQTTAAMASVDRRTGVCAVHIGGGQATATTTTMVRVAGGKVGVFVAR